MNEFKSRLLDTRVIFIMQMEIFADVRAEVKPIILDGDDRRGWSEADPAVAQEPNATKHPLFDFLHLSFSLVISLSAFFSLFLVSRFSAPLRNITTTQPTCV